MRVLSTVYVMVVWCILDAAKIEYCFGQVTSATDDLSMGLTSVPITSKSYLQFTSLLMYCTICVGCSLVIAKG